MDNNKKTIFLTTGIFSLILVVIGITVAWFTWSSNDNSEVTFAVEGLGITYSGDEIVIEDTLYPTASMANPDNIIHEFSLATSLNTNIYTHIYLEIIRFPQELKHESFRYSLYREDEEIATGNFKEANIGTDLLLINNEILTNSIINYTLYVWIDGVNYSSPTSMGGKTFEFKLKIEASQISQIEKTREDCFGMYEDILDGYYCYENNDRGLPIITDVVIPDTINGVSVNAIMDYTFDNKNLTSIIIPDSVTWIGYNAFSNNNLTTITLPNELVNVGFESFSYNKLTEVIMSRNVTYISEGAFLSNNLAALTIPDGVIHIGAYAFSQNKLTNISIPDSVTSIGNGAFSYNNLTSVYVGLNSSLTDVTGIEKNAFSSSADTVTVNQNTYVNNPNLTNIYNNSSKSFDWTNAITGSTAPPFITNNTTITNANGQLVNITIGGTP